MTHNSACCCDACINNLFTSGERQKSYKSRYMWAALDLLMGKRFWGTMDEVLKFIHNAQEKIELPEGLVYDRFTLEAFEREEANNV